MGRRAKGEGRRAEDAGQVEDRLPRDIDGNRGAAPRTRLAIPRAPRPSPFALRPSLRRRLKFALYEVLRLVVNAALRPLTGFRPIGWRNMPRRGPVIVVANHLHNLDPVVISAALPRPIFYMGKRELFTGAIAPISRAFGAFPVNRDAIDRGALRQANALLGEGLAIGLFPEGTRSLTGALSAVHPGVALVALQSGAPILPVAVTGTEYLPFDSKAAGRARPKGQRRPPVRVTIGPPFTFPARKPGERQDLAAVTERIMLAVTALLPPAYRGVYADQLPADEAGRGVAEGRGEDRQ